MPPGGTLISMPETPCLVLAHDGLVLSRHPTHAAAADAAHTTHAATYAWIVTEDGTALRHRPGRRGKAPAPVWPTLRLVRAPPGCPVLASLRHPRTFDEGTLCKVAGRWHLTDPVDDAAVVG